MHAKKILLGSVVIGLLMLGGIQGAAQTRIQHKKCRPAVTYDETRDRTIIVYDDGRTIIIDGCWDERDAERFFEKLQHLSERLAELDDLRLNIELPEIAELDELEMELEDLDHEIQVEIDDAMRDHAIELERLKDELAHLGDIRLDLEVSHLRDMHERLEHELRHLKDIEIHVPDVDVRIPEFPAYPRIDIRLPRIDLLLESCHDLEITFPEHLDFLRTLEMYDLDRGSVREQKRTRIMR